MNGGMARVKVSDLTGADLDWARYLPKSEQPKTFACNHNGPTCRACHDSVIRWLEQEVGDYVHVPAELVGKPWPHAVGRQDFQEATIRCPAIPTPDPIEGRATQVEIEAAIEKAVAIWNGDYSDSKCSLKKAIYEGVKPFLK